MKLSIIIPYYNTLPEYTDELLDILAPQMRVGVECLIVDDGSEVPYIPKHDWCRLIYQKNGGTSVARNTGIDNTTGEYISFIDSDDTVASYFVDKILAKIDAEYPDFIEMSWKTLPGGQQCVQKLNSIADHLPNPSVCHRVFKRTFIGKFRFNPSKISGEDEEFSRKIGYNRGKRSVITDYMCFYRTYVVDSKTKRFMRGEMGTRIIVYYYPKITKDMKWLIDEVKKEDVSNQVFVLTYNCEIIDELRQHARVYCPPRRTQGHELRGEYTEYFSQLYFPINTDIVIYMSKLKEVSGIGTFTYNFCKKMKDKFGIVVLYDSMDSSQIKRLYPYATVMQNNRKQRVVCKTLIMNSVMDQIPGNIVYQQSIQMVHACSDATNAKIPLDRDRIVYVSDTAKKSWGVDGEVVRNMVLPEDGRDPLLLITASRFDSHEKGQKRIKKLAKLMNAKKIPFVWLYFSSTVLPNCEPNLIKMEPTTDIRGYIRKADYLVQLSDTESFCYSMLEAITDGVPVITTPMPILEELGINESNAHIVPFDIPDDYDVEKFLTDRKRNFRYAYDNESIKKKWMKIINNIPPKEYVKVEVTRSYSDLKLSREIQKGEVLEMEKKRALQVQVAGCCKILV